MPPNDAQENGEAAPAPAAAAPRRPDDPGAPHLIEVRVSKGWRRSLAAAFVLLIALPGLLREFTPDQVRGTVADVFAPGPVPVTGRLRAMEKRVDEGAWTAPVRKHVQTALFRLFREGNRKVLVGRDGWLFHRPGVQALTNRGPVLGPTNSVAKDPALAKWESPLPVIREFAAQLQQRGIRLILVPVPDKAALWSTHLPHARPSPPTTRVRHPDWEKFTAALHGAAEIVDLPAPLPYLPTDTHWQADGARAAAQAVAAVLHTQPNPPSADPTDPTDPTETTGIGDLVASLGAGDVADPSLQTTTRVPTTPPAVSDTAAPIVLLGDSNVNMYDDPGLPFHRPGGGFASWLAAGLGEPLHIIAINGGGASQVRQRFAALPDDVVRAKSTVIWVLAERDLLIDPATARANGVEWKRVAFNPNRSDTTPTAASPHALVVEATLRAKSKVFDRNEVDYPDAVFTAEFTVDRVIAGSYTENDLAVVLWNFRNRVVQPTARLTPGQKVRLTLVPWLEQGELTNINLRDDFNRFDLTLYFASLCEVIDTQ